ncbi:hypothetical protein ACH47C_04345 [Streptomyces rishiriensis]|uniref:hypothetical protein n=1 Tax=Streptomyces rishiriensis TaxID=68264 RepID=UPI0033F90977
MTSAAASGTVVGGARLAADGVQADRGAALPRKLTARAWLLADQDSGEVLACYRAHLRLAPASMLKMLFAGTLLGRFARTERHTVTGADLAGIRPAPAWSASGPGSPTASSSCGRECSCGRATAPCRCSPG